MQVLEGLDPVRKRPGMYIGSTGPTGLHHCVWEVVDNSVDEAMAGHATRIDITLLADGGCRVVDDGRGIPTDVNKQQKMTGVEIALTKLHGGGKFGGEGYKVSGGLHGVGVSVVNALSTQARRRGRPRRQAPPDGVRRRRQAHRRSSRSSATRPAAAPAPPSPSGPTAPSSRPPSSRARTILERLQMMAFLNKGLEIRFKDERPEHKAEPVTYQYAGGIIDFVKHLNTSKEAAVHQGRLLRAGRGRTRRSRSPSSGTPATTPTASTPSPTASTPPRAAPTRRASRRPSPPW